MNPNDMPAEDKGALAANAKSRDFSEFVERHGQFAYRVAFAMLRNASDAEDAVQETFMKLYKSTRWKAAESERAYLARSV